MADAVPSSKTSSAFPITIIVLLAIFAIYSPNSGRSGRSAVTEREGESQFVLEVSPAAQEAASGGTVDFVVRYENASNRPLKNAALRVIAPTGASFDYLGSKSDWEEGGLTFAEMRLGMLSPGEKGAAYFTQRILSGEEDTMQETTVIATWDEAVSDWKRGSPKAAVSGQAVVKANVLARKARESELAGKSAVGGARGSLAALAGAKSVPSFSPTIGWAIFTLLFAGVAYFVVRMMRGVPSAEIKMNPPTGGEPPDNLPI